MIAALLPLLSGATGRVLLWAGIVAAVIAAGALALHQHDANRDAARVAAETAATLTAEREQHAKAIQALQDQLRDTTARAARTAQVKEIIRNVPVTRDCAASPAIRAALAGLRAGTSAGSATGNTAVPAGVSGSAGRAGVGH